MVTVWTLLLGFGLTINAQTSIVSVFLPIIDAQPLVASLSQMNGDIETLIIQCPSGGVTSSCGFPTPVTVTAGPSTVALTTVIGNSVTVDLKCGIDASTKASCTQVYTGPASLYTSGSGIDGGKTTTWTASQSIDSGKVTYLPVTVTAGTNGSTTSGASTRNAGAEVKRLAGQVVAAGFLANIVGYLYS